MNARLPKWSDLEVFLATARAGTLAGAGDVLGVNASTVQRRMGVLETTLRTRLFERNQRGYSLTAAGEVLLEHAQDMEQQVLSLGRQIGGMDENLAGAIRVGTVDDLAISLLSPLCRDFLAKHPRVTLHMLVETNRAALDRNQLDVALRFGDKPRDPDVVARHVAPVAVSLYARRSYLKQRGRPKSLADLSQHDVVRGDAALRSLPMERAMEAAPGRIAYRSDSMLARLVAIRDGIGIGFLPCFMADTETSLERLKIDTPVAGADLWLLVHADLRRNARVRAFADFAHAGLSSQRARFEGE